MTHRMFWLASLLLLAALGQLSSVVGQSAAPLSGTAKNAVLDRMGSERETGKTSASDLVARYKNEVKQNPKNPEPYVKAAAVYDRKESEELFKQALAMSPNYLPARLGLARYYAANPRKALAEYQKAIALAPKDAALRNEAASAVARGATLPDLQKLLGNTLASL